MSIRSYLGLGAALLFVALFGFASLAHADHSWGGYHWARTTNPFTVKLGTNVTGAWVPVLATASADWSADPVTLFPGAGISKVLNTSIVAGTAGKNCKAVNGMVQVCNSRYGNNGWLGIAQIWINGSHITAGTVKLNDTYFNTPTYNTTAWKNLVTCQEVGHTFGLDHQDETFGNVNLNTCMDYTNDPTSNQHPNLHDYQELGIIYAHLDSFSTLATTISARGASSLSRAEGFENASDWGRATHFSNGKADKFEKDLGNGEKVVTHVFWEGEVEHGN